MSFDEATKKRLEKQQYRLIGNHSAVKVCEWTKKSLTEGNACYKEQFYGISSHRCVEMTPAMGYCNHKCIFCWRMNEKNLGISMDGIEEGELDEPEKIIEGCIEERNKLLVGFKGNEKVDQERLEEALNPNQFAISLDGEPTLYPKISELIEELDKRNMTKFLVTNGTRPDVLAKMTLPTYLYLSLDGPDEKTHNRAVLPQFKGSWDRVMETVDLFPSLDTTKNIRLTLVKGINMIDPDGYGKIILRASPDYVEVKAYMLVGASRERLTLDNMPRHEEVKSFAEKVAEVSGYSVKDEKEDSRVVLLSKN